MSVAVVVVAAVVLAAIVVTIIITTVVTAIVVTRESIVLVRVGSNSDIQLPHPKTHDEC